MDYSTVNTAIKQFKIILKTRQNDLIKPFLEPFSQEERYKIVWYLIVEKLKYFTPDAFRVILPMCDQLKRSYVVTHFLILYRYDLADVCKENGFQPSEKYIKNIETQYIKYCKGPISAKQRNKSNEKHESDSSDTDDYNDGQARYKGILDWLNKK